MTTTELKPGKYRRPDGTIVLVRRGERSGHLYASTIQRKTWSTGYRTKSRRDWVFVPGLLGQLGDAEWINGEQF